MKVKPTIMVTSPHCPNTIVQLLVMVLKNNITITSVWGTIKCADNRL